MSKEKYPPLPEPDTHCWDDDTSKDVWSYSAELMREIIAADRAARGVPDAMALVAEKYAHKLALDLECVLSGDTSKWWDSAMQTISDYRSEMNAIHERESPTFMGEPVLKTRSI